MFFFETSSYGQKISKFKYPIRIGNIILNNFNSYFDNSRTDVPILNFYADCFDLEGTDKSYIDLKTILVKDLNVNKEVSNYERSDQKYLNFNANDMNLSICYTYDSDWQFNSGYTSLTIKNKRLYPDFLVYKNYEAKITISDYLILEGNIGISGDYKRNRRVKRRPQKIIEKFDNQTLIWIDDVNFKIGFSSSNFSHVFDSKDIKSFFIQNILPAKGGGGSYLELLLEDQQYNYSIFTECCYFFDKYSERIMKLTNKEVNFGQEYYDC